MLETSRVVKQADAERNYHVFYQLLEGAKKDEALQARLKLLDLDDFFYLNQTKVKQVPGINDEKEWDELVSAMKVLGMSQEEQDQVMQMTAAVLHIGNIKYEVDASSASEDGCKISDLNQLEAVSSLQSGSNSIWEGANNPAIGVGSVVHVAYTVNQAVNARDALAKAIYGKLFNWLILRINKSLEAGISTGGTNNVKNITGVLDIFGFESFETNSLSNFASITAMKNYNFISTSIFLKTNKKLTKKKGSMLHRLISKIISLA